MKKSNDIKCSILLFFDDCKKNQIKPTEKGLVYILGIGHSTLTRIQNGYYAPGKPYTKRYSATRAIANEDFALLYDAIKQIKQEKERWKKKA